MYEIVENCTTAKEFIDCFLSENILQPKNIFDVSERVVADFLFRGQSECSWPLLPVAHRLEPAPEFGRYTPQTLMNSATNTEDFLEYHIHAEIRSVHLFLEAADRIGIKTPLDYNLLRKDEFKLRNIKGINQINSFPPSEYYSAMALAQHYGIPTRLMDWTYSPFVAAYFAALNGPKEYKNNPDSKLAVYCLCTRLINDLDSLEVVNVPYSGNDYLRAQQGVFLLNKKANAYYIQNNSWPSIKNVIENEREKGKDYMRDATIKITLPTSESKELLKLLYRLDISELTMMPSLASAAKSFQYKNELFN